MTFLFILLLGALVWLSLLAADEEFYSVSGVLLIAALLCPISCGYMASLPAEKGVAIIRIDDASEGGVIWSTLNAQGTIFDASMTRGPKIHIEFHDRKVYDQARGMVTDGKPALVNYWTRKTSAIWHESSNVITSITPIP